MLNSKTIRYFLISFCIILFCLTGQFIYKYSEDIFFKGYGLSIILELIFYSALSSIPTAILISTGISSAIALKNMYMIDEIVKIRKHIYRALVFALFLSVSLFMYLNYIAPKTNLNYMTLLYDIRHNQKDSEFIRTDKSLFEDLDELKNVSELGTSINTIGDRLTKNIELIESYLGLINSLMPSCKDTITSHTILSKYNEITYLRSEANWLLNSIKSMRFEVYSRYLFSFFLLVIFITGLFFGYLLRYKSNFILVLIMVVVGITYFLCILYFQKLLKY